MSSVALPASPAAIAHAKLPELYEASRRALSTCARVDECKEWVDKAAALQSYARQSKDETLLRYANRIRARAVRRAGQLLEQVPSHQDPKRRGVGVGRLAAARAAGMSRDQERQALRVARLPEAQFEREIEGDSPATVVQLARLGIVKRKIAVPEDTIPRARAQLRLRALLREVEECAADIEAIASAPKHFGRLLLRSSTLRDQVKHASSFFAQLADWMADAEE